MFICSEIEVREALLQQRSFCSNAVYFLTFDVIKVNPRSKYIQIHTL